MAIGTINPYAPAELETKMMLGWQDAVSDQALAYKTAVLRLYNIGAAVDSMELEVPVEDAAPDGGEIGAWNNVATTALPISPDLTGKITNYTVLKIEDELVVVKTVNRGANTVEVYQRGHGGTTAAAHAAAVYAQIEGYNYVVGRKDIESRILNNTFNSYFVAKSTVPSVSFTKEDLFIKRKSYGIQGREDYVNSQITRMDQDLLVTMNKAFINQGGQKGTATIPATLVGLIAEALTKGNVTTGTGALTLAKINAAVTVSRNKGGFANVIICSPAAFDTINGFANDSNITVTVPNRLQVILGATVAGIVTKVGKLTPVLDTAMPDDKVVICNSDDLHWSPLVGFTAPGADRTIAQESTRNDQAFTVDSIAQGATWYTNSNRNMSIMTGVTA